MDRFSVTQAIQPKTNDGQSPALPSIGLIGNRLRCCPPLLYGARLARLAGPILPADPHPALAERAPSEPLEEGPDTDVFVVRAASAPERLFLSSRFRFLATTVETAGRYSFLAVDIPVGGGPRPHVHQKADEWFYVLQGDPVFHVDDRAFKLAEGDLVHILMGTTHWFEVLDAPIKVLAGYCPAGEELAFL
jgi:mannose-6-phosphate isomerase-like protein (cupin superfamily)